MKKMLSILLLLASSLFITDASAVIYSCPWGSSLSGTTCTYWTTSSSCSVGFPMPAKSSTAITGVWQQATSGATSTPCVSSGWVCPSGYPFMNSAFTLCYPSGSNYCPSNSVWGSGGTYGTCYPKTGAAATCPSGYTISSDGSTCTGSSFAATVTYQCHPGDTLLSNNTCQPPTLYATPTTHYYCLDKDGNGVTDPFVAASTCRPNLLAYKGEIIFGCPIIAGDPDPVVAGSVAWSLNGSLQAVTGYTVTGPLGAPIASSMKWIGGTTCSYQPPTVDGIFSFLTHFCTDPTFTLDSTGLFCIPPKQPVATISSSVFACTGTDVLSGSTCTPTLQIFPSTQQLDYACDPTLPLGTILNAITHLCVPPAQTQPPTLVSTLVCGPSAKLNTTTNMCDYVSIPALNIGGQYSCPPLYLVGIGANTGWCIPTMQWAYSATWNLTKYDCPNGGTLGLAASGQPNGLCYMP